MQHFTMSTSLSNILLLAVLCFATVRCAVGRGEKEEDTSAQPSRKQPQYPCDVLRDGPKLPFRLIHNDLQAILHRTTLDPEHACTEYEVERLRQALRNFTDVVKPQEQVDALQQLVDAHHSADVKMKEECYKSMEQTIDALWFWQQEMNVLARLLLRVEEECDRNWPHLKEFLVDAGHMRLPRYAIEQCDGYREQCGWG